MVVISQRKKSRARECLSFCSGSAMSSGGEYFPLASFCHPQRTRKASAQGAEWLPLRVVVPRRHEEEWAEVSPGTPSPLLLSFCWPGLVTCLCPSCKGAWESGRLAFSVSYKGMWAVPERMKGQGKSVGKAAQREGHRDLAGVSILLALDVSCVSCRGRR